MIATFATHIEHSQVVVSWPEIPTYFIWTDEHVAQGFAWSPVRAAFLVPDHDGLCQIEVGRSPDVAFDATDAIWALRVPFDVLPGGVLIIGCIDDPREIEVGAGRYGLVFAAYPGAPHFAFRFLLFFQPDEEPGYEILKAGSEVTTDVVLRRNADPI